MPAANRGKDTRASIAALSNVPVITFEDWQAGPIFHPPPSNHRKQNTEGKATSSAADTRKLGVSNINKRAIKALGKTFDNGDKNTADKVASEIRQELFELNKLMQSMEYMQPVRQIPDCKKEEENRRQNHLHIPCRNKVVPPINESHRSTNKQKKGRRPNSIHNLSVNNDAAFDFNRHNLRSSASLGKNLLSTKSKGRVETAQSDSSSNSSDSGRISIKTNANNNFLKQRRGMFYKAEEETPCENEQRVCEGTGMSRIDCLALPKRLPCQFVENKPSVYWANLKKFPRDSEGITIFDMTPRLEELSKPMRILGKFMGTGHCYFGFEPKKIFGDPDAVDWDRLSQPRMMQEVPVWPKPLSCAALHAIPTKRTCKLAVPRRYIDSDDYYLWLWHKRPDDRQYLRPVGRLCVNKVALNGARVLIRVDLDPTEGCDIEEKIEKVLPTFKYIMSKQPHCLVICTPSGHPNGKKDKTFSLKGLEKILEEKIEHKVFFLDEAVGPPAMAICENPEPGTVFLLENLRFEKEEDGYYINEDQIKIECTPEAIKEYQNKLAQLGDVFIIDEFTGLCGGSNSACIQTKAMDKAYGLNIKKELDIFNRFLVKPKQPCVAVLGGSFKDMWKVVQNLMGKASEILLGGEIGWIFAKAIKGVEVGNLKISLKQEKRVLKMMSRAQATKTVLNLPSDLVVRSTTRANCYYTVLTRNGVDEDYEIVDIGEMARKCYARVLEKAKTIVCCGTLGSLGDGTHDVVDAVANATKNGAELYIVDDETRTPVLSGTPKMSQVYMTGDGRVTSSLIRNKIPKNLASLDRARQKIKKRPPRPDFWSSKPIRYETVDRRMVDGSRQLVIDYCDLQDKRVLIRCDFNVPINGIKVMDNYRIRMTIPSIKYALKWGAKAVILIGHRGRPNGKRNTNLSLKPVCDELQILLGRPVIWVPECIGAIPKKAIEECHPGSVLMLENLRFHPEETKVMENVRGSFNMCSPQAVSEYCHQLSSLGDVFINDAFPSLVKDQSSISGIMIKQRAMGFLVKNELKYLSKTLNYPPRPWIAIIGGRQVKSRAHHIRGLLREVDAIIVTGALAFAMLKVDRGYQIGSSLFEEDAAEEVHRLLEIARENDVKIHYPIDFVIARSEDSKDIRQVSTTEGIPEGWAALDIGELSRMLFKQMIKQAKLLLWDGVPGMWEKELFSQGTGTILKAVIEATQNEANPVVTIVGGRSNCEFMHSIDTNHEGLSHVTTGGKTMSELINERTVLGVDVLSPSAIKPYNMRLCVDSMDLKDMRVLLKGDLDWAIIEEEGLKILCSTIRMIKKREPKVITVIGHIGHPEGQYNSELSLEKLQERLQERLKMEVDFFPDGITEKSEMLIKSKVGGAIVLLENIRFHPEEEQLEKIEDDSFVKLSYVKLDAYRTRLANIADVYVNDSFRSMWRMHTTVTGIVTPLRAAGPTVKKEIQKLSVLADEPPRPFIAIVGSGETFHKLGSVYGLLDKIDEVIFVGDMANTVLSVMYKQTLGDTTLEEDATRYAPGILKKAALNGVKIHLPVDVITASLKRITSSEEEMTSQMDATRSSAISGIGSENDTTGNAKKKKRKDLEDTNEHILNTIVLPDHIPKGRVVVDIGPESITKFTEVIMNAKSILLMGLAGRAHDPDFEDGTSALFKAVADATSQNQAYSVTIGRTTNNFLERYEMQDQISHASTGFFSTIDMIIGRDLPGIAHLSEPLEKPLKKMSIQQLDLKDKRVLLRLDTNVPTVENVVLDTDRIEESIPTINYCLDNGAKCVIILGHRGNPKGYKNVFLSHEPLVQEFSMLLQRDITFLPRPCSGKTRTLLADPKPGSVFLMENLRFYPAEDGIDAKNSKKMKMLRAEEEAAVYKDPSSGTVKEKPSQFEQSTEEETERKKDTISTKAEDKSSSNEDDEETPEVSDLDLVTFDSDGAKEENIDTMMFQLMAGRSVEEYVEQIGQCGDVFILDNVLSIKQNLTSFKGFGLPVRAVGLQLSKHLQYVDASEYTTYPGIAELSDVE